MKDQFDWAEDILICKWVVWSRLAVSWSHRDSSRPVTEVRNSCINVGDHVRLKSRTSIFRNVETVMVLLLFKKLNSCRFRACTGRVVQLTGSIPLGLQCTGNLWQLQCKLDFFCRGYQLVLCYRRVIERQQQMLLQYTELFVTEICCKATSSKLMCNIWDSHSGVAEDSGLLGYEALLLGISKNRSASETSEDAHPTKRRLNLFRPRERLATTFCEHDYWVCIKSGRFLR